MISLVNYIYQSEQILRFTILEAVSEYWFEVIHIKFVIKIVIYAMQIYLVDIFGYDCIINHWILYKAFDF